MSLQQQQKPISGKRKEKSQKEIRLLGKVAIDERRLNKIPAHFHGRIEKLYVNYTGEKIRHGQLLAEVYSPELISTQQELIIASKNKELNKQLYQGAVNKLKNWKISDSEIRKIEETQKVSNTIKIYAHHSGTVIKKNVTEGDHVTMGDVMFELVDLNSVWVLFEAYETDLAWVKMGDHMSVELKSIPGKILKGKVTFIDPFINSKTRVAYVRVELSNKGHLLKPGMFATGVLTSELSSKDDVILVPKSAVLWTGKRGVVYVKVPNRKHNSFIYREVILGEEADDFYIVKKGLTAGEEIATNGVFKIDAASQLAGKKSMMNQE